jgi:hypothetical protein
MSSGLASINAAVSAVCLALFAVLPLAVLGVRFARPRRMPWWAVFTTTVGLGWGLAFVGALVNESAKGGAGHMGALFLGWAIALAWLVPWLLVYGAVQWVRHRIAARRA